MFATPLYAHTGRGAFANVYDPAEDTFLLMDAMEQDAELLLQREHKCIFIPYLTLISQLKQNCLCLMPSCTDINPLAAACTTETARCNEVSVQPVITDLVSALLPRLLEKVDILLFNPPYVVTPSEEVSALLPRLLEKVDILLFNPPYVVTPSEEVGSCGIEASWAGGRRGREVMDRLFPLVPQLLSNQGLFYLVTVQENNPGKCPPSLKLPACFDL
ncbi:UNVERIFIED_CONTAM: hypothetical protein FKN15_036233 [Acipenser sinensis]